LSYLPADTAILLFTRTSSSEAKAKNFLKTKSYRQNKKVADRLIDHSLKTIRQTSLPHVIITEKEQVGFSFGEKLCNAIEGVFSKGFKKVIIIGNDCLQLRADKIVEAAHQLCTHDMVTGATGNGGVYLIGVTKQKFCKEDFERISWQTSRVFNDLTALANYSNAYTHTLPSLHDISSYSDLINALKLLSITDTVFQFISSIIASLYNVYQKRLPFFQVNFLVGFSGLRAPPLVR
jgi:hypothetical protein